MNKNQSKLYIGSQSSTRKQILAWAQLTAKTLSHSYDEDSHPHRGSIEELVQELSIQKMNHLTLPEAKIIGEPIFLITADTLIGIPNSQIIFKKPKDLAEAHHMLQQIAQQPVSIQTGCTISVKTWNGTEWQTVNQKTFVTGALVEFCVDQDSIQKYFALEPNALHACGASVVDSYGQSFFKSMNGSYSAILGLPLFELRAILKEFNFTF